MADVKTVTVELPDGRTVQVDAPDGATPQQIFAFARDSAPKLAQVGTPAVQPGAEQGFLSRTFDRVKSAVKGNAAEDLPDVFGPEFDAQVKKAGVSPLGFAVKQLPNTIFGGDEKVAQGILDRVPGSRLDQDINGNPIIVTQDGSRFFVNEPGLDANDALRFGALAASFGPAGRLARGAAGSTLAAGGSRLAATGAAAAVGGTAAGATDVAGQSLASGEIDATQTGLAVAGGSLAEIVAPVLGAIAGKVRSAARRITGRDVQEARAALAQSGVQVVEADVPRLARALDQVRAGADPTDLLAESEFGFRFTRGQKLAASESPEAFRQLRAEEALRASTGTGGDVLRAADRSNEQIARQSLERIASDVAGGNAAPSQIEAAARVAESVRGQADELKGKVGEAFDAFRQTKAFIPDTEANAVPQRIARALAGFDIKPGTGLTGAARAAEIVEERLGNRQTALSLKDFEQTRRIVLNTPAANKEDRKALAIVREQLDTWLDDVADRALVNGDAEAITIIKQARGLRREFGQRFEQSKLGKRFDTVVKDMIDGNAPPEQLARAIFGAEEVAGPQSVVALRRIKAALGSDTEAFDQLRASVLQRLGTSRTGSQKGLQALESNIKTLLTQRPTLAKELFTGQQRDQLGRLASALNTLNRVADKRSSGTAERALAFVEQQTARLPFIGQFLAQFTQPGAADALRALAPLPVRAELPALRSALPPLSAAGAAVSSPDRANRP